MKIVIIIGVLLVLFLIFKPKMSYLTPPPRKTDQEVEVESVADIAISSGACGIRPTIA
jgi:hypothetical protein